MWGAILCLWAGHILCGFALILKLWRSCEHRDRPNTFVLSLPRCLKIPGWQEDHSLPLVALKVPGRRPSKCWWLSHSAGEPGGTQSTGYKIQQLQAPGGNLGQKCDPIPSLVARDTSVIICFLWGLSDSCSFIWFLSLDYDCYIDEADHTLRIDLICRRVQVIRNFNLVVV